MIRLEAIITFNCKDFDKLKELKRKDVDMNGRIFVGDTFVCDKELAEYFTGKNDSNLVACKVIEVIPEEVKPKRKTTKK